MGADSFSRDPDDGPKARRQRWGIERKFYRVVEALGVEDDRCILVLAPHEPVSRGHGFVAA
jgi:hypothetical protein